MERRKWCNGGYYNALPAYLKSRVRPVDKQTTKGSQSTTLETTSDYVFLLSERELFGIKTYAANNEGTQYGWYANSSANKNKVSEWWTRSPRKGNSSDFVDVYNGNTYSGGAGAGRGLAPAFCL